MLSLILAATVAWKASDFGLISFMDDVQIAPSGNVALIDVGHPDFSTDQFSSAYRAITISNGASKAMPPDLGSPRWSPDGTAIAWTRPNEKTGDVAIVIGTESGTAAVADLFRRPD